MATDWELEAETILRWDRTGEPAILYTADPAEVKRWERLGYPVEVYHVRAGKPTGWRVRVPIEAIALLPFVDGQVKTSRYLEPPTIWTPARKGRGAREASDADQNIEEINAEHSSQELQSSDKGNA